MDAMDCILSRNLLSDLQDGTLDPATEARLAAHLRGCGECAGAGASLLAVRKLLRSLPPDPAPPELLQGILAAVEAEGRDAGADPASVGADATRPFLSRFRIPLEAAAAVLLFASVYWYQYRQPPAPAVRPPSVLSYGPSSEAGKTSASRPMAAIEDTAGGSPPAVRLPHGNPGTARKAGPAAPKPRTWTAENLPSAPAYFASTDSERIVPVVPSHGPTDDPAAAGTPAFGEMRSAGAEGGADSPPSRVFAAPPSRLLRPLPYGRDIVVDVKREAREGAEERIAGAALLLGGIVERMERDTAGAAPGATGTVRVILPESAAARFIEEMDRIGTIPPEGKPVATDLPAGPRPGTVAYAVRIRVR